MRNFVLIIFVLALFSVSCNRNQESDLNLKHLNNLASKINRELSIVTQELANLTNNLQYKVPFDKDVNWQLGEKYSCHSNKILFSNNENLSAVYYLANNEINKDLQKIIINSEQLDSFFIDIINTNPIISQVYFLAENSFLRIYPYIDVVNYLNSQVNLTNLITYKSVNNKPFIDNKAYWINKPFADPYGRGWIVSCVEPLYYRDRFLGIISGDISLKSLKNKYLSSNTDILLLINKKGELICCTKEGAEFLDIPQYRDFQYYKPVTEDVCLFKSPTLSEHKNKNFKKAIKKLLEGKTKAVFFSNKKKHTIYKSYLSETDWYLLKIIN